MKYIIKQRLYQNKVNYSSQVSTCNCKMDYSHNLMRIRKKQQQQKASFFLFFYFLSFFFFLLSLFQWETAWKFLLEFAWRRKGVRSIQHDRWIWSFAFFFLFHIRRLLPRDWTSRTCHSSSEWSWRCFERCWDHGNVYLWCELPNAGECWCYQNLPRKWNLEWNTTEMCRYVSIQKCYFRLLK